MKDRLGPSISYLQRLSPEYMDTIFQYSKWILNENSEMALEVSSAVDIFYTTLLMHPKIFTSEEVELSPQHVADFLESVDRKFCARYLEFLIEERHEESHIYHDRLAELYLRMTKDAKRAGDTGICQEAIMTVQLFDIRLTESRNKAYGKLLLFIDDTTHFRVDRLLGMLPSDGTLFRIYIAD